MLEVKLEETSTFPADLFPTARVFVDEDAEGDVFEAQQSAPIVQDSSSNVALSSSVRPSRVPLESCTDSLQSTWTFYTEVENDPTGCRCFLAGTFFFRTDGTIVPVDEICVADQLQGPGTFAQVKNIVLHPFRLGSIILLWIKTTYTIISIRITHDHRMTVQSGDYKRACDLKVGDFVCTPEGDVDKQECFEREPVFEVTFEEDRPVYITYYCDLPGVTTFGSEQCIPYNPVEFVEFRFKGQICKTMGLAETWLNQKFQGRLDGFHLKYWISRKYAVWVSREQSDEFWEMVSATLGRGSKLYRRPVTVSIGWRCHESSGISTPPLLTP